MIEVLKWTCCCIRKRENVKDMTDERIWEKEKWGEPRDCAQRRHSPLLVSSAGRWNLLMQTGLPSVRENGRGRAAAVTWIIFVLNQLASSRVTTEGVLRVERCNHVTMGPRRARVVSFSSFLSFLTLYTHQRPPAAPAYIKSHCIYPAHVQRVSHSSSCCFSFPDQSAVEKNKNTLQSIVLFFPC